MSTYRRFVQIISLVVILAITFSGSVVPSAYAQENDGLKRQYNAQTGKLSFIGPASGRTLSAARFLGMNSFAGLADPGMALVRRFGPEFGLKNPEHDLTELGTTRLSDGRMTIRYQQNYQGIPVLGGELIANINGNGDLYSINGEISADLSVPPQPKIDSEQARHTAHQTVAKWYEMAAENFLSSQPQLRIYDEGLLQPSARPAELVWHIEITAKDVAIPVRELVLVNAERGHISLHFNQIDTAWNGPPKNSSVFNTAEESTQSYATINSAPADKPLQAGVTWYVSTTGNNANSCSIAGSPCKTINGAISKATTGDVIRVAVGTYTGAGNQVVNVTRNVTLSGGWNSLFTVQDGISTIDGDATRRVIRISNGITATIERFVIQNGYTNDGTGGAGIYNSGGALTLKESTISDNDGGHSGSGGGIANMAGGVLTINSSTVSKNKVNLAEGGGLVNTQGTVTLNNSTVSGNTTNGSGSGIYMYGGTLTVNNSTIYGNSSTYFGSSGTGINNISGGNIFVRNSIIAGNTNPSDQGPDCEGTIISLGYNLIGSFNSSNCQFTPTTGDIVGPFYNPINPLLGPLQDNGGLTFTHALLTGSSAIDAGNSATPASSDDACLGIDQRGVSRPVGARCDIGAYEGAVASEPTPVVNTYTAGNGASLPGTFVCNQTDPDCAVGDSHARAAHKYAIGTSNLYTTQHARDSIDNNGMTIISSVHYSTGYTNAFWNGYQMVYGDAYGFPLADDVVAHELTHGVTQFESNLFYYYQSGAINESLSDLWGEYYDQTNSQGTDTSSVKWQIGEDISGYAPLRSMSNPTLFGDPDKMSSLNYYQGTDDSGGVHTNSGINNKAIYLMVDGGTFNGKTVTALGWDKVAAVYYEVNANLLSSGADYSDLYYALQQACSNLIGQKGITSENCIEVKDAIDAVEMNGQPAQNFATDAPHCDSGDPIATIFSDGLESGKGNWTFSNGAHTRWQLDSPYGPYAHSGNHFLYANDYPGAVTDASAQVVPVTIPSGAYLHFAHAYDFEASDYYYDGGVLEYRIAGGATWVDAGSLIDFNGYKGTVFTGAGNPLSGRSAFVGASHGYTATRLNLTSLAGKTVTFRWRMGLDQAAAAWGWWVDDVRIYQCQGAGKTTLVAPSGVISTKQPSYTWNADPLATWYYLWIDGPNGNIIKRWYQESAICNAGMCSVTPANSLSSGNYTWWVQTWSEAGYGPWSEAMSFSISLPPRPGKANLTSPNGGIDTNNPTYIWNEVPGATWYYLWVDGPSGNITKTWYTAAQANCNGTTCSVTSATRLAPGPYAWWVQTWNEAGYGPWSDRMTFSLPAPPLPGKATLVVPNNNITVHKPTYTWNQVSGSTWYYLWVDGPSGNVIKTWYTSAQANCNGSTCSVTPDIPLRVGSHTWWIQTWNDAGYGPWSDAMSFSFAPPGRATLVSPSGNITDQTPIYTWNAVGDATWYYLWVNGPSGVMIQRWYKAIDVCESGTCSVEDPTVLSTGAHTWWIQTWNDAGYGPWSTRMDFLVP